MILCASTTFFCELDDVGRFCLENRIAELQTGHNLLPSETAARLRVAAVMDLFPGPKAPWLGEWWRTLAPRMGLDQNDPDLVALGEEAHYLPT